MTALKTAARETSGQYLSYWIVYQVVVSNNYWIICILSTVEALLTDTP